MDVFRFNPPDLIKFLKSNITTGIKIKDLIFLFVINLLIFSSSKYNRPLHDYFKKKRDYYFLRNWKNCDLMIHMNIHTT